MHCVHGTYHMYREIVTWKINAKPIFQGVKPAPKVAGIIPSVNE